MAKGDETLQRILQEGLSIASLNGLAGVSLAPLADRANLSKSGLFAHFRSKEALQIKLLETAEALFKDTVIEPSRMAPPGLPRLEAMVDLWLGWAPRAGLPGGCPFAAAAADFDDRDGPVRERLVASQREWIGMLRKAIEDAVAVGHLRAGLDSNQLAFEICGIYLMHHFASRLLRSAAATDRARTAFQGVIAAARPAVS
jgi:AcrR family transcriptional regulator